MTALLDRLDDAAATAVSGVGGLEIFGWACIIAGAPAAVLCPGGLVALYFWGDLLTVGDLW